MKSRYRLTARARLTLLYGLLFVVAGGAMLAIDLGLVHERLQNSQRSSAVWVVPTNAADPSVAATLQKKSATALARAKNMRAKNGQTVSELLNEAKAEARRTAERQMLTQSGIALITMTVLAVGLGYLMAGRALRPVHAVSATARRISGRSLHERIPLHGPPDEMRELAETFNDMLARLDDAFTSQRHFIANASHELHTPIATQRTLIEVAARDPQASAEFTEIVPGLLATLDRQEELVAGLLTLARADNGLGEVERIALDQRVRAALAAVADEARDRELDIRTSVHSVSVTGDRVLLDVLLSNVFRNAVRHNVHSGAIRVKLFGNRLVVENDGVRYEAGRVPELLEPFRRGASDRTTGSGSGLGLAMVVAVARAHRATLELTPRPTGGLRLCLTFDEEFAGDDAAPVPG